MAFTEAGFASLPDIRHFTDSLGLKPITLFGQEGFLASCLTKMEALAEPRRGLWIDYAYRTCERREYLAMSSHIMRVGQRQ